ncbi:hypothetical protein C0993_012177 [Termitomyces sp. T159_Od127]|nr:hypothetical protein C0993_012177 [Termitomyces sp. T159_Od127]
MSTDKKSKAAPPKDKKSKRKSVGSTSLPSADTVIESDAPVNVPLKAKVDVVQPEKHKKEKSKGRAAKELKRAEEPSSVSPPLDKKTKTKSKENVTEEVEHPEDNSPAPSPPAAAEKQKKTKTKTKSETSESEKPTTKSSLTTVSKSISATSKASFPPKPHKASGKASQKSKKKEQKGPTPPASSVPETEKAEEAGDDSEQEGDEDLHLHGFSTDDDDSSDEDDDMDYEAPALDISQLPTIAKDDATVKRKLEKAKRQTSEERGVVYIGRVPHGFYEDQMRGYFSQFGDVTRVRLSRNKKTGRSKHYGFIEFNSSSVAQIVAETMDNYLLKGHILKCKVIPKDEVHPELWVGANRKWKVVPQDRLTRVHHNKIRTEGEQYRAAKRLIKRQEERKRKLAKAGIDYDIAAVSYKKVKKA